MVIPTDIEKIGALQYKIGHAGRVYRWSDHLKEWFLSTRTSDDFRAHRDARIEKENNMAKMRDSVKCS